MDEREELTALDRALVDALDVDVSPGFQARVRQRIADDPSASVSSALARHAPLAAAAIVVLAAGATAMLWNPAPARPLPGRSLATAALRPAAATVPVRPRAAAPSVPAPARIPPGAASEPEVLVPREQIEMYQRLIAEAQKTPHALVVEPPGDITPVGIVSKIAIDPIKIDLIVPPVSGEGDRQ